MDRKSWDGISFEFDLLIMVTCRYYQYISYLFPRFSDPYFPNPFSPFNAFNSFILIITFTYSIIYISWRDVESDGGILSADCRGFRGVVFNHPFRNISVALQQPGKLAIDIILHKIHDVLKRASFWHKIHLEGALTLTLFFTSLSLHILGLNYPY